MRVWLLPLVAVVAVGETIPLQIARGEDGVARVSMAGAAIPLVQEGALWAASLAFTFRCLDATGKELERKAAVLPLRFDEARRAALLGERVSVSHTLAAGTEIFEVSVVARPTGATGSATLAVGGAPAFRAETALVLVPFRVERAARGLVTPLTGDDIVLTEDGQPREAQVMAVEREAREAMGVDISLLFDCSGSVHALGALDPEVFRRGLLEEFPNVRIAVYGFSDDLVEMTKHTRDERALEAAAKAMALIPTRSTPLFGSIQTVIRGFDPERAAVRMLVVFSDGESTTPGDLGAAGGAVETARRAGVAIYPVQLSAMAGRRKAEEKQEAMISAQQYQKLAERTGGRGFARVSNQGAVEAVLREVAGSLRGLYVASYRPEAGETEREREVRIVLKDKRLGRISGGTRLVVR